MAEAAGSIGENCIKIPISRVFAQTKIWSWKGNVLGYFNRRNLSFV